MKKILFFLAAVTFVTSGCTRTWSGIKQDTHEVFSDTKEIIHGATAPKNVQKPKSSRFVEQTRTHTLMNNEQPTTVTSEEKEVITPIEQ